MSVKCTTRCGTDGLSIFAGRTLKAGHIDRGLFAVSSEGILPQGGFLSPLLSNIMIHEFDAWMEAKYLNRKIRKDRWAWNAPLRLERTGNGTLRLPIDGFVFLEHRIIRKEGRSWKH